jgi:hypothetical protein
MSKKEKTKPKKSSIKSDVPDAPPPSRFPVALRKVPGMTGWAVDELAKILHGDIHAGSSFFIECPPPFLSAYEWRPGFEPIKLQRKDWAYPLKMINDLSDKYSEVEPRDGGQEFYDEWRRKALGHIHPSWFVWSDELKDAFDNYEDPDTMIRLDGPNIFRWEVPSSKDLTLIFECPDELLSKRDRELKKQSQAPKKLDVGPQEEADSVAVKTSDIAVIPFNPQTTLDPFKNSVEKEIVRLRATFNGISNERLLKKLLPFTGIDADPGNNIMMKDPKKRAESTLVDWIQGVAKRPKGRPPKTK